MKDVLGYEFFTFEDGTPLELDPAYGEKFAQDYNRKIGKLAWDIAQLLKIMEKETGGDVHDEQETAKPTIYLAECSYERRATREILEAELRHHGYSVLPDRPLPQDEADYVEAVERLLERCQLSIHIVGEGNSAVPNGPSRKSVVVLQNELAVRRSKSDALMRLIWLPEGTHSEHEQHQTFIAGLHQDADAQFGADLITGDLENLKTSMHATLMKLEDRGQGQSDDQDNEADRAKVIFMICDEKDRKATVPVRKYCKEQGFEVSLPAFEGDATAVRKANTQLMANCDAVLLFYGAGEEAWKRTVDSELKKLPGYRGGKPLLAKFTYLADPRTADKQDLIDMEEADLIDGVEEFSETRMAEFVRAMNPSGATP
jgi:hypothetical protein